MNRYESVDVSHEGFRVGGNVVGYDRGEGSSAADTTEHEAPRERGGFDPAMSYGQTRAAFEADFEQRYVSWLLQRHSGNISAAAREARMDRKHLHDLAKKHGLRGRGTNEKKS